MPPTTQTFGSVLREHLDEATRAAGITDRQEWLEQQSGVPQWRISYLLNDKYPPKPDELLAIERALGLRPGTVYVQLGYVELPTTMHDMIRMDPLLTPDGKRAMRALYESPSMRRPATGSSDGLVTGRGRAR